MEAAEVVVVVVEEAAAVVVVVVEVEDRENDFIRTHAPYLSYLHAHAFGTQIISFS